MYFGDRHESPEIFKFVNGYHVCLNIHLMYDDESEECHDEIGNKRVESVAEEFFYPSCPMVFKDVCER